MENDKKKKISLKGYLIVFLFFMIFFGNSSIYYGIGALLIKLCYNLWWTYFLGTIILLVIKSFVIKKFKNINIKLCSFIICIMCVPIVVGCAKNAIFNFADLILINKEEVVTVDYNTSSSYVGRRGKFRSGYYGYFLNINNYKTKLEIGSNLYFELEKINSNDNRYGIGDNIVRKENVKIKVVYWKLSKVIDTIEIIEEE